VQLHYTTKGGDATCMFQSSPVPKDGCNAPQLRIIHAVRVCFNPHPSRRTGATKLGELNLSDLLVSILTRPEGRVQPSAQ